ncbi:MAG: phosphopyruvate hydratase, partial [Ilumatobacteraceae bacterium]
MARLVAGIATMSADPRITAVRGRRVWDSRGRPTVEVEVHCGTAVGRAIAPAGASTGSGEAVELRDGGTRLGGLDVAGAVANVNTRIAATLAGADVRDQRAVDDSMTALDPSPSLGGIGANAVVAASMAVAHAAAAVDGIPLWASLAGSRDSTAGTDGVRTMPLPEIQIFGGGAHAGRRIDIQDLMIVAPGATSFAEALEWTAEVYLAAGAVMSDRDARSGVADEGGWWPAFATNEEAIEALVAAIERAGFTPGEDVAVSLDIAASELWRDGRYRLGLEGRDLDGAQMIDLVIGWCDRYPIVSIEDPVDEHDVDGFRAITAAIGHRVQIVGDDLFVTDAQRVDTFDGAANAVLIKANQAGTLSRAADAVAASRRTGRGPIVSARSGESEDV